MKMLKKICKNPDCQAEFETTHHARVYCCNKCAQRIANKARNERVRAVKRYEAKPKTNALVDIATLARKEGLSYGQYVLKCGV